MLTSLLEDTEELNFLHSEIKQNIYTPKVNNLITFIAYYKYMSWHFTLEFCSGKNLSTGL
jgi:hypothetical protein